MKTKLRQKAIKLRLASKLSYSAIRKKLGVPKSTLSYWLRGLPLDEKEIKIRQRAGWKKSEAGRERFRNTMRQKKLVKEKELYNYYLDRFKQKYDVDSDVLFVAGLMLYMGEGDKKTTSRIALSNTDPNLIKFFILWMENYLGVQKQDVKIQLHLYDNMELEREYIFWQTTLGLAKSQFYKISVRKLKKSSFSYKDSIRHGTCSINVFGVDRKMRLSMAIKAFVDEYIVNKGCVAQLVRAHS